MYNWRVLVGSLLIAIGLSTPAHPISFSGGGGGGGTQYAEDAVHTSGDTVTGAGVVRKDTAAALAGADGDYALLEVDANGRLHVNLSAVTSAAPMNVRLGDGTDLSVLDASGNLAVYLGVALDRTNVVTLSDNAAARLLEINAENSAFTNAWPAWVGKVRTAIPALTNGNHASPSLTVGGSLWVGEKASAGTPAYAQITCDTTATGIVVKAANASRRRLVVTNHGTTAVYIGSDTSVTSANGFFLAGTAGATQTFYTTSQIRCITASGSQVVSYFEEAIQ